MKKDHNGEDKKEKKEKKDPQGHLGIQKTKDVPSDTPQRVGSDSNRQLVDNTSSDEIGVELLPLDDEAEVLTLKKEQSPIIKKIVQILKWSSAILVSIALGLFFASNLCFNYNPAEKDFGTALGQSVGQILAFAFFLMVVSYLVWRYLFRRKGIAGLLIFSVCFFGFGLTTFVKTYQANTLLKETMEEKVFNAGNSQQNLSFTDDKYDRIRPALVIMGDLIKEQRQAHESFYLEYSRILRQVLQPLTVTDLPHLYLARSKLKNLQNQLEDLLDESNERISDQRKALVKKRFSYPLEENVIYYYDQVAQNLQEELLETTTEYEARMVVIKELVEFLITNFEHYVAFEDGVYFDNIEDFGYYLNTMDQLENLLDLEGEAFFYYGE